MYISVGSVAIRGQVNPDPDPYKRQYNLYCITFAVLIVTDRKRIRIRPFFSISRSGSVKKWIRIRNPVFGISNFVHTLPRINGTKQKINIQIF